MILGIITLYKGNKVFNQVKKNERDFLGKNTDNLKFFRFIKDQFGYLVFRGKYMDIKNEAIRKECDQLRLLYFFGLPIYIILFVLFWLMVLNH
jgi:hypothetical protein